jgi:hypothetical protein
MLTEQRVKELLQEKISDLDKLVAKLDSDDDEGVTVEMYQVADELEGAISAIKEVLEIKG